MHELRHKTNLSMKTASSGKTGQFSGKQVLRSLEAEFGKTLNMKVVEKGFPRGQRGPFSKIRLQWPRFLQKSEPDRAQTSCTAR